MPGTPSPAAASRAPAPRRASRLFFFVIVRRTPWWKPLRSVQAVAAGSQLVDTMARLGEARPFARPPQGGDSKKIISRMPNGHRAVRCGRGGRYWTSSHGVQSSAPASSGLQLGSTGPQARPRRSRSSGKTVSTSHSQSQPWSIQMGRRNPRQHQERHRRNLAKARSRGPASVLAAGSAVDPVLCRLRRHREPGMGPRFRGYRMHTSPCGGVALHILTACPRESGGRPGSRSTPSSYPVLFRV